MSYGEEFVKMMDFATKEMFEIKDYFCVTVVRQNLFPFDLVEVLQ